MRSPRALRRRATPAAGVALLLSVGASTPVAAQDSAWTRGTSPPATIPAGTVVRVRGRGLALSAEPATVVEQRGDTLVLRPSDGSLALVPLGAVSNLEISRGRGPRSDGAWRGARVGALLVGVPMTLLTSYALAADLRAARRGGYDDCMIGCPASPYVAVGGLLLTGVGTLAGAAIGAAASPRDRWARVDPRVRVGAGPAPRGGGVLTLSYRF